MMSWTEKQIVIQYKTIRLKFGQLIVVKYKVNNISLQNSYRGRGKRIIFGPLLVS